MGKIQDFVSNLRQKPFIQSLINDLKSDVYVVGGATRDLILNKPNKDIDLIVRTIPIDTLISHLQKFGRVDVVGKSFGVIKFIDKDGIDYDLALPRKEQPNGEGGYRGFDVQSDENLPIEDDLIRRDAKMNAMAININTGKFIDPLGGLNDIEKKQISSANPQAFSDDPLRMIRIVAFASRFGFNIEPETLKMIQDNAARVKEISPERILIEFDKIIKKGDKLRGVILLKQTGLLKNIFGNDSGILTSKVWDNVKTMGEFIYLLSHNLVNDPAEFFKNNLKGDLDSYKEIKALSMAFESAEATTMIEARSIAHNMFLVSPASLNSLILPDIIKTAAMELLQGKYPKTVNELAVNGGDLMQLGLKGKAIGDMQKSLLLKIYADKVFNNKEELLNLAGQNNQTTLNTEGVADKYAEKEFNIPDVPQKQDVQAMGYVQQDSEQPVGVVVDHGLNEIFIYKNPRSLSNFDSYVRAIADSDGNLYVAQANARFNHGMMAQAIGLVNEDDEYYNHDDIYQSLHRISTENGFGLSDTSIEYIRQNYDNFENAVEILKKTKRKNPQYNFYSHFYDNGDITDQKPIEG